MAVAEAVAHGLPVVATMAGAIPELVGNDAGLLVPVGDTEALAESLARVLSDADLRVRLAEGARLRRNRLPAGTRHAVEWRRSQSAVSRERGWITRFLIGYACASRRISRLARPH